MTRTKRADAPAGDQGEQLDAAVNRLADEVGVLRQVLDEFRSQVWHGLLNGKFAAPAAGGEPDLATPQRHAEVDTESVQNLTEQVESLRDTLDLIRADLRENLGDAIHEQTKEMESLRHSMDDFTTDVQWAARKVREKPTEELNELRETLQGEIVDLRGSVEQFMTEMHDAVTQIHDAVRREKQGTLFDPCVMSLPPAK